jgi:hypothetical protein
MTPELLLLLGRGGHGSWTINGIAFGLSLASLLLICFAGGTIGFAVGFSLAALRAAGWPTVRRAVWVSVICAEICLLIIGATVVTMLVWIAAGCHA